MISGRCTIFLSLHDRIDPETCQLYPHHVWIRKLPATFIITDPTSITSSLVIAQMEDRFRLLIEREKNHTSRIVPT